MDEINLPIEAIVNNLNAIHSNLMNDLSVRLATAQATVNHLQQENNMLKERLIKLNKEASDRLANAAAASA
jgi:hypothetical protein